MKALALYFDAPFQSWGESGVLEHRKTLLLPTQSAVYGLFCAALGISRGLEHDVLTVLAGCEYRVFEFMPLEPRQSNLLQDYHTITTKDGTVLTKRDYLVDSSFGAIVAGETREQEKILHKIEFAMKNPVWGGSLGRKCCVPQERICLGLYDSLGDARQRLLQKSDICRELVTDPDGVVVRDIPLDFEKRLFDGRMVMMT